MAACCVFVCESCTPAAVNEVSSVKYEVSNPYDHYAIALKKQLPGRITRSVVGHMWPKELSIVLHGASVAAKVIKRSQLGWRFLLKYQLRCFPESKYLHAFCLYVHATN